MYETEISFLWSLLTVLAISSCSDRKNDQEPVGDKIGEFTVKFAFEAAASAGGTKAASTAIPETSWKNIKQLQFLIYDVSKRVVFSDVFDPSSESGVITKTYTEIPVGNNYTIVAVANAKQSTLPIQTFLPGAAGSVEWGKFNVRQKNASQMLLKHKPSSFPAYFSAPGKSAFAEPAEIFIGSISGVNVTAGNTGSPAAISLKREVSLMRVRLNVKDADAGVNNMNSAKGVDFTKDASVVIYRLPNEMKILAGNEGGVGANSEVNHALVVSGTADMFKTSNPSTGYNPKVILGGNFTMWRDIIVFPNDQRSTASNPGNADVARQYFIVVSGRGKIGHVLADGTTLNAEKTVFWSGVIKEKFISNQIREVNITLQTGGSTVVPQNPLQYGGLNIKVNAPAPWDSNIVSSDIIL